MFGIVAALVACTLLQVSELAYADETPEAYSGDAPIRDVQGLTGFVQGEFALRMRDGQRAVMAFRRTTQAHPDQPIGWLKLSEALRLNGDFEASLEALNRAEEKGAEPWQVAHGRAQTARANGQPDVALTRYHQADWSHAPEMYFDEWYELASAREDELAQRRAAASFTTAHPNNAQAWGRLGGVLRRQGYLEPAIEPLQRAAELPDGSPEASEAAASILTELGEFDRAITQAEACIDKYRAHTGCYVAQLEAHYRLQQRESSAEQPSEDDSSRAEVDLDSAIEDLARMTSATPRMVQGTGRQVMRLTDGKTAIKYVEAVIALRPYNKNMREVAAWLAVAAGEETKAIELFEAYFEFDDRNASALNYVGYTLAEREERLSDAERYVRRALELKGDDPNIRDSLAWVLFKRGRLRDALDQQLRVAEELPTNAVILDHLGDIYHALGRESEAREAWRKALDFATEDDEDVLETVPQKLGEAPEQQESGE
jgi:tetratricopeptide (TPR) repeat protein